MNTSQDMSAQNRIQLRSWIRFDTDAIQDALNAFICPACKESELRSEGQEIVCHKCDFRSVTNHGAIPNLIYMPTLSSESRAEFDLEYVPDDPERWLKKHGSTEVFVDKVLAKLRYVRETSGSLRLVDVGSFMYRDIVLKPFVEEIRGELDEYWALDPSLASFPLPSVLRNMHPARAVGESLPVASGTADCVLSISTLDHLVDFKSFMEEALRVLKPNGFLFISLNNDRSWFKRLFPAVAARQRKAASKYHNYFWGAREFLHILESRGFVIDQWGGFRYVPQLGNNRRVRRWMGRRFYACTAQVVDVLGNAVTPGLGGNFWVLARRKGA